MSDPPETLALGMLRTFKYQLQPNASQECVLDAWRRQCAELYNAALEQRITWWHSQRRSVHYNNQTAQLTELRAADASFDAVPTEVQRSALRRLNRAFAAFFRRCRNGEKPGFPRFRATRRYDSFEIGRVTVKKDRVHVPKLGHVKMRLYRPIGGKILNATIRRDGAGKWWVSFQCDLGPAPAKCAVKTMAGIDLGLTPLATTSTGDQIENPRFAKRAADQLARRQRDLARKQDRSKNREKARILVAKSHVHVANQRLDHARKEAKKLFDQFDAVAHEDLSVRSLASGMLSKSFADASWGVLLRCIASKAEEAGKHAVPVDYRRTSQECCGCGRIVPKDLSDRVHRCICGLTIARDHNSAIVICARGWRALESAQADVEGEVS